VAAVKELVPMTPDQFKAEIKSRGWDAGLISLRWGMTKRRVLQIVADEDRPRYYDDAIRSLPLIVSEGDV
jgi:hypothetical protein